MNQPTKTLALLIVEDVESDALLIVRLLKKAGYEPVYEQVETAAQMRAALEKQAWDIIISDYRLPQFNGEEALAVLNQTGQDIPFIAVSGTMGEETAVAMMKAGAQDYLMKDNLARLVPAVQRELEQAEVRRERRQAQEQLLLQSSALNAAANAIVITNREGIIEWANPAFTTLTQYTLEEAAGKNPRDILKSDRHDQSYYRELWNTILAGEVWHGEMINRRKDGSLYTEEMTITPLKNADGVIDHFIAIKQDITKRKQAENALRESTTKLETLIRVSPLAFILLDTNGNVQMWNSSAERIFGWTAQEVMGGPNPIVPRQKQEEYNAWKEQILQGNTIEQEAIRQHKDGSLINVSISSAPVYDGSRNVIGRMAIIADITARKQTEEALAASEAELRALFASMHDVVLVIDRQGVYRKIAPTNYGLLVNPPEELLGKNLMDVFPAEQADYFINTVQQVLNTKQTAQIEYELLIGDRTVWFETFISPMDKDSTLWVARDITERKQTEQALAASEAELRALVEQVPAIVYTESAETRETTYISPRLEKVTGYTPAEWIDDHDLWQEIIHPEDRAAVVNEDERTTATREPFQVEYRILTRDGRTIWIQDEAVLIQNQVGAPLFWQGVMYDITERKQFEEAMQTTNILLEQTLEQSPIPMVLVSMPDGIIRSANSACRRFLGIDDELSHVGSPLSELKVSWQDFDMQGNPATFESLPLPRSLRGLKTVPQERHIIRKDGTSVYGIVYGSPIFNSAGKVIAGYLVMTDITERKQAEMQLRKLAHAVDQNPVSIVITDLQGNIEYVNPKFSQVTGYSFTEALGKNPRILKSGNTTVEEYKKMWDTILSGNVWQGELLNKAKNGKTYWESATIAPVFSEDGRITNFLALKENITERKQAEEALRESQSLYHSLVEVSPLSICRKDLAGRFTFANRQFLESSNISLDNLLGKTDFDLHPSELAEKYRRDDQAIMESGQVQELIEERTVHGGESTFVQSVKTPIYDGTGKINGIQISFWDITERKRAELNIHQHVKELEMLHQSGLALSQLLNPKEIGEMILELLEEKLDWHNTRIRLYHPENDSLELLDFNQPGLNSETGHQEAVEHFQSLITHSGEGMSGWVVQNGQPVRSGDVNHDPRYVEAYPGIRSGLYVPMKLGERTVGVISIEDEQPDAFSEADERLIVTLANQAASAFENARLFEETHKRVMELETINRISLVMRTVSNQNELLPIVLDEALAILNTSHGYIDLHNQSTDRLEKIVTRGWPNQINQQPQDIDEGIAGKVFTSGDIYFSREFASDPITREAARNQIPPNWGGVCLPIRATQQILGVIVVSVPSERELDRDEVRMLLILSEMTGAALQRMQLHEQTARRLEQLNALHAVEQSISNSHDMRLTLTILLTHIITQLKVDAADVLLLHPSSSVLELVAGRGFHTLTLESTRLGTSFAGRAIMERRPFMEIGLEAASQHPQFGKVWKAEGFVRYWCVPLIVKGSVKGALEVYSRSIFTPDTEWIDFLKAFAGQAAIAIDNTQLFEDLQRANMDLSLAYDATIEGWSRALDLRDHETEGHTLRVSELTLSLARAMQVNESQLTAIRRGSLLHDIGKMGVPDAILLKEGPLTDEEWVVMRQHPQFAHDMLLPIDYLHDALDIPYCHHEKWDGMGYPRGLQGTHIPLAARIFAVVDVWDALTNDRSYRKKWTAQKAREYIEGQSGTHFDPQVVEVFLNHIE